MMNIKFLVIIIISFTSMCYGSKLILNQVIKFDLFSLNNSTISPYLTKVFVGTPPRAFNLLVDTGSDLSWIDCTGIGLFFNVSDSSTASMFYCSNGLACTFEITYKDGFVSSGYLVSDVWHFNTFRPILSPSQLSSRIVFGCSSRKMLNPFINGIIGLGRAKESLVSQLFRQNLAPKVISHCLGQKGDGYVVLGEAFVDGFTYSPLIPSEGSYQVSIVSFYVNGRRLDGTGSVGNNGTIVDSGTTFSLLVASIYDPLVAAISAALNKSTVPLYARACYEVPSRDSFPQISITFVNGPSIQLLPEDYLLFDTYWWCLGFQRDKYITILGDLVLRNKVVVYDQLHDRLGLLGRDCSQSVNVSLVYDNFTLGTRASSKAALYWSHAHLLFAWFIYVAV